MVMVTGFGPQMNVMTPPRATALTTAADVQPAGVPVPTALPAVLLAEAVAAASPVTVSAAPAETAIRNPPDLPLGRMAPHASGDVQVRPGKSDGAGRTGGSPAAGWRAGRPRRCTPRRRRRSRTGSTPGSPRPRPPGRRAADHR